jgi:hypothetical protein
VGWERTLLADVQRECDDPTAILEPDGFQSFRSPGPSRT